MDGRALQAHLNSPPKHTEYVIDGATISDQLRIRQPLLARSVSAPVHP